MIAPALITLAANLVWTGEFDEGERWLQRTVAHYRDRILPVDQAVSDVWGRIGAARPLPALAISAC